MITSTMAQRTGGMQWLFVLGLAVFLGMVMPVGAGQPNKKNAFDAAAEAKQAAQEDAEQAADHIKNGETGKYQKLFHGTFLLLGDSDKESQPNPDVLGSFVTDNGDKHPGRAYLIKVDGNKAQIMDLLKKSNGKKLTIEGKLRNEDKYLVVGAVTESGGTAAPKERGGRGGL